MKFTFVKEVAGKVTVYGNKKVKTGDIVDYDGFFAEKAKANPDFQEVIEGESTEVTYGGDSGTDSK